MNRRTLLRAQAALDTLLPSDGVKALALHSGRLNSMSGLLKSTDEAGCLTSDIAVLLLSPDEGYCSDIRVFWKNAEAKCWVGLWKCPCGILEPELRV